MQPSIHPSIYRLHHSFITPSTHLFTHLLIAYTAPSQTRPFISVTIAHTPIYSLTHPSTQSFTPIHTIHPSTLLTQQFTHSLSIHTTNDILIHQFNHTPVQTPIYPCTYVPTHSPSHSVTNPYLYSSIHPPVAISRSTSA